MNTSAASGIPLPFNVGYSISKSVVDYRYLPLCVDRPQEHGTVRKVFLIWHNYGTYGELIQIKMGFWSGEVEDIKKWRI